MKGVIKKQKVCIGFCFFLHHFFNKSGSLDWGAGPTTTNPRSHLTMDTGRQIGGRCIIFSSQRSIPRDTRQKGKGGEVGEEEEEEEEIMGWAASGSSTRSCGAIMIYWNCQCLASTEVTFIKRGRDGDTHREREYLGPKDCVEESEVVKYERGREREREAS